MKRIALTDGSGRWFDLKDVLRYDETTWFDGRNHISRATGSQWNHEELLRTKSGRWIKHSWSQWQGSHESYEEIDAAEAARWFALNEYEEIHEDCEAAHASLQIG